MLLHALACHAMPVESKAATRRGVLFGAVSPDKPVVASGADRSKTRVRGAQTVQPQAAQKPTLLSSLRAAAAQRLPTVTPPSDPMDAATSMAAWSIFLANQLSKPRDSPAQSESAASDATVGVEGLSDEGSTSQAALNLNAADGAVRQLPTRRVLLGVLSALALSKPLSPLLEKLEMPTANLRFQKAENTFRTAAHTAASAATVASAIASDGGSALRLQEASLRTLRKGMAALIDCLSLAQSLEEACRAAARRLASEKVALGGEVGLQYKDALTLQSPVDAARRFRQAEAQAAALTAAAELEDSFLKAFGAFQASVAALLRAEAQAQAAVRSSEVGLDGSQLGVALAASAAQRSVEARALAQQDKQQLDDAARALEAARHAVSRAAVDARAASELLRNVRACLVPWLALLSLACGVQIRRLFEVF